MGFEDTMIESAWEPHSGLTVYHFRRLVLRRPARPRMFNSGGKDDKFIIRGGNVCCTRSVAAYDSRQPEVRCWCRGTPITIRLSVHLV